LLQGGLLNSTARNTLLHRTERYARSGNWELVGKETKTRTDTTAEINDVCGFGRHRVIRKRRRQEIVDVMKSLFACFDAFAPYGSVDTAMLASLAVCKK
jgi:hypothetical protein